MEIFKEGNELLGGEIMDHVVLDNPIYRGKVCCNHWNPASKSGANDHWHSVHCHCITNRLTD